MLTKTIDGLFIATRYGVWGLGVLGIPLALILCIMNITIGLSSALICVGMLLLAMTVTLALLPKKLVLHALLGKRFMIACITGVLAIALVGIVYFINGEFPNLNLLFM